MDYKEIFVENAWGGVNADFGLLHVQLATPTVTLVIILVMIFVINKLLFQPVLRTLDSRAQEVESSQEKVQKISAEIESSRHEVETRLAQAYAEVGDLHQSIQQTGFKEREEMIAKERVIVEELLEKSRGELAAEVDEAHKELLTLKDQVATATVSRLLS